MNERIKELWLQAGGYYNNGNQYTWPEYTIDNPEKFAELIVRECAKIADDLDVDMLRVGKAIKEYFGVKELEEFEVWVCEKCGADRTKEPCQLAVEGKAVYGNCTIIGVAQ